jgi:hypothetical protein
MCVEVVPVVRSATSSAATPALSTISNHHLNSLTIYETIKHNGKHIHELLALGALYANWLQADLPAMVLGVLCAFGGSMGYMCASPRMLAWKPVARC